MKMDFKEYFKKYNAQKRIDKFAKKYAGKKVVLYGAGYFANDLFKNYNLSKINITGISDLKFEYDDAGEYIGYKKIAPSELPNLEFDVLCITAYDDELIKEFLEDELFENKNMEFKVETLIKLGLFDYIKKLFS